MAKGALKLRCPICQNPVKSADPDFPFCSERCRTIDLGKWASNGYVVSTPMFDPDETEQPGPAERHQDKEASGGSDSGKTHPRRH